MYDGSEQGVQSSLTLVYIRDNSTFNLCPVVITDDEFSFRIYSYWDVARLADRSAGLGR